MILSNFSNTTITVVFIWVISFILRLIVATSDIMNDYNFWKLCNRFLLVIAIILVLFD